ncbi:MAG: ABC transporter ATP-binding protein [Thermodesulfobacteriota bacterium]
MLEVDGLDVFYGDFQALWGVSFAVKEKEIVAIIGSNGAGKTTLLKTLAGLLRPALGRIRYQGLDLEKVSGDKRVGLGISLVLEGRGLFPGMSVLENLEMGAFHTAARQKRNETLRLVYEMFPILERRKRQFAGTLSGGEQQMLAVGRSLMSKPKLLLLDEPSMGLAPLVVKAIFEAVDKISRSGMTVALVEQNVRLALRIANRAYIIENGRIVREGDAQGLLCDESVRNVYLGIEETGPHD